MKPFAFVASWAGLLVVTAIVSLGGPASAAAAAGPSFRCGQGSAIEAAICSDPALADRDRRMAAFFQRAKPGALGTGSNQLAVQRRWLKDRDAECSKLGRDDRLKLCLTSAYDARLEELTVATLLASPKDSLAELQRIRPAAARMYEALLLYVSADDPVQRTKVVEPLVAPLFASLDEQSKGSLKDVGATTARGVAASDVAFARFFVVTAVMGDTELTWPCAALLKRPGLIAGLGAFWGGAIDGRVPGSDCEATLPPVPAATALSQLALEAQPPCDGTIRFSTGRDYAMLSDAVRMHRPEIWSGAAAASQPDADEAKFRRRRQADIAGAQLELAAYYRRVFGAPAPAAAHDADTAVRALVSGPFNLCE